MTHKERFYAESRFGGFTDVDGTMAFFNRVNSLLEPSFIVCDVGCGRGSAADDPILIRQSLMILKGKVSRVIGIDVDNAVRDNDYLDEFRLIQGSSWLLESDSIDLISCDFVMEHVENPDNYFSEARRVLKDGGYKIGRASCRERV